MKVLSKEEIAEGVAEGIQRAKLREDYLIALAAQNEPAPPWYFWVILVVLLAGFGWWLS